MYRKILRYKKVTSTQDIAKKLAEKNYPSQTIVIAETQTAGRGRFQRKWYSPPGGLYFSIILRPKILPADVTKISILTSIAVCTTLNELYELHATPEYPNDVMVNGKKICGILVEMYSEVDKIHWVVVGIGINANISKKYINYRQQQFIKPATSIEIELNKKISLNKLFNTLIKKLEEYYRDLS